MKILIVEDNHELNDLYTEALTADGHTCASAFTPDEALALYREDRPDAIVLDFMLPGISAEGLLEVLKPHLDGTRIVIVTAANHKILPVVSGVPIDYVLYKPNEFLQLPVALGYKTKEDVEAEQARIGQWLADNDPPA